MPQIDFSFLSTFPSWYVTALTAGVGVYTGVNLYLLHTALLNSFNNYFFLKSAHVFSNASLEYVRLRFRTSIPLKRAGGNMCTHENDVFIEYPQVIMKKTYLLRIPDKCPDYGPCKIVSEQDFARFATPSDFVSKEVVGTADVAQLYNMSYIHDFSSYSLAEIYCWYCSVPAQVLSCNVTLVV